jgi:hypothetical protein
LKENLTLRQSMSITPDEFQQELAHLGLFPTPLDQTFLSLVLDSNPNYNYLYSNYSASYDEPMSGFVRFKIDTNLINFLYGPDLDVNNIPIYTTRGRLLLT